MTRHGHGRRRLSVVYSTFVADSQWITHVDNLCSRIVKNRLCTCALCSVVGDSIRLLFCTRQIWKSPVFHSRHSHPPSIDWGLTWSENAGRKLKNDQMTRNLLPMFASCTHRTMPYVPPHSLVTVPDLQFYDIVIGKARTPTEQDWESAYELYRQEEDREVLRQKMAEPIFACNGFRNIPLCFVNIHLLSTLVGSGN